MHLLKYFEKIEDPRNTNHRNRTSTWGEADSSSTVRVATDYWKAYEAIVP